MTGRKIMKKHLGGREFCIAGRCWLKLHTRDCSARTFSVGSASPFNLILVVRCRSILAIQFFISASLPGGILKYLKSFPSGADLG